MRNEQPEQIGHEKITNNQMLLFFFSYETHAIVSLNLTFEEKENTTSMSDPMYLKLSSPSSSPLLAAHCFTFFFSLIDQYSSGIFVAYLQFVLALVRRVYVSAIFPFLSVFSC